MDPHPGVEMNHFNSPYYGNASLNTSRDKPDVRSALTETVKPQKITSVILASLRYYYSLFYSNFEHLYIYIYQSHATLKSYIHIDLEGESLNNDNMTILHRFSYRITQTNNKQH